MSDALYRCRSQSQGVNQLNLSRIYHSIYHVYNHSLD